ncbi:MAG: hypothetical protein CMP10_18810 [Zetaproteobacteria bacterium]|nr:hypothetical protein [Pseudobdellovibrionaceae bacterium]
MQTVQLDSHSQRNLRRGKKNLNKEHGQILSHWYQSSGRDLPWRLLWTKHQNPYHVWLSEIMLQQTVIKAVIPAYDRFLKTFPSILELAKAQEEQVRLACRGLGYYRRFSFLHKAAKLLVNEYQDPKAKGGIRWPTTYADWMALPGIGEYTAAAISSICFDQPKAVVDGNVERVLCRLLNLKIPPNLPVLKKEFKVITNQMVPQESPGDFNQGIMELGQTVCTVKSPSCQECPIKPACLSCKTKTQHLAPAPKIKKEFTNINVRLAIPVAKGKIGLIQRSKTAKFLKETWGFPTYIGAEKGQFKLDQSQSKVDWKSGTSVGKIKHTITHHKIEAEIFETKARYPSIKWFNHADLEEKLLASLDQKAWKQFTKNKNS